MNAPLRTGKALAAAKIGRQFPEPDLRVLTKRYGGIQGPLFEVAVGDRCFLVGELTKTLLMSGTPLEELDMLEIDPDADREEY